MYVSSQPHTIFPASSTPGVLAAYSVPTSSMENVEPTKKPTRRPKRSVRYPQAMPPNSIPKEVIAVHRAFQVADTNNCPSHSYSKTSLKPGSVVEIEFTPFPKHQLAVYVRLNHIDTNLCQSPGALNLHMGRCKTTQPYCCAGKSAKSSRETALGQRAQHG